MIRVRLYSIFLSLPLVVSLIGLALFFASPLEIVDVHIPFGVMLIIIAAIVQVTFLLTFACPICGKSPYIVGPFKGPLGLFGKPVPETTCSSCGFELRPSSTKATSDQAES